MGLYQILKEKQKRLYEERKKLFPTTNGIDPITKQEEEVCYDAIIVDTLLEFLDLNDPDTVTNQKDVLEGLLKIYDPSREYAGSLAKDILCHKGPVARKYDIDENGITDTAIEWFNEEGEEVPYGPPYWAKDVSNIFSVAQLFLIVEEPSAEHPDYSDCVVYGSWDNWQSPHTLKKETIEIEFQVVEKCEGRHNDGYSVRYEDREYTVWKLLFIGSSIPKKGYHTFKLQKNGVWIEPGTFAKKQQTAEGTWNNVIYIHH